MTGEWGEFAQKASMPGALERLLEETWEERSAPASRHTLAVEAAAGLAFLAVAIPLAVTGGAGQHFRLGLAALLVVLYAVFSRSIKLSIGAGSFVPSYLVLVPMLVLLPPATVPLLAALGLVAGTLARCVIRRNRPEQVLFAVPDAWHAIGPAAVLMLAGVHAGQIATPPVLVSAFLAGCFLDLVSSTLREWLSETVLPALQARVIMVVWAIDACFAPLGLLIAYSARKDARELLLLLPVAVLLMIVNRDRQSRIAQSRQRMQLAARERERAQNAARRVFDALAARLDIDALADVVMAAALDAVSAESGCLVFGGDLRPVVTNGPAAAELRAQLDAASAAAWANSQPYQLESEGKYALAVPLSALGRGDGVVALARHDQAFDKRERRTLEAFIRHVESAAADVRAYQELRVQALTDSLTGLGNRRKLMDDLSAQLGAASAEQPLVLALFDLDGFKGYNDGFGHPAGDAMLAKLGSRLAAAVAEDGAAYRLGGDEFCILSAARSPSQLAAACEALTDTTSPYPIAPSCGSVLLPREASTVERALSLADERMYQHKRKRARARASQTERPLLRLVQ
jgi:diguanylate cyclase (GGDEF)-like protein